MKKIFIALVAMVMMTMSVNAQSNNNRELNFDRLSNYLELRINQVQQVKTAMAQFDASMEALYQIEDSSKGQETWDKIQTRHKQTMKRILSDKQYEKYVNMLDLTIKNSEERIQDQQLASN